ncbi:hypothetical protein GAYE_SCF09G3136 [Galdieria yellowstonensis]|uniref:Transmembrane protein n=1 Tax=Galdieria yellowstonensis TaxID=3028027 RepID=A0AAV9ICZ5_9RHOD|nr:hypothetical protein GAYE_SCF09G3136 [Galdieria yellowstonensis]
MIFRFLRVIAVLRSSSAFEVRANFLSFCLKTTSLVNSFVFLFCGVALYKGRNFGLHFSSSVGLVFSLSCCIPCVFWIFLFLVHTGFVFLTAFLVKVEENLTMTVLLLFPRRQKLLGQFEGFVLMSFRR